MYKLGKYGVKMEIVNKEEIKEFLRRKETKNKKREKLPIKKLFKLKKKNLNYRKWKRQRNRVNRISR